MEYKCDEISFLKQTFINMWLRQNSIDIEPFHNHDLSDGKHLLIAGGEGLDELSEGTSQHQHIFFTIFGLVCFSEVNTQQVQWIIGNK